MSLEHLHADINAHQDKRERYEALVSGVRAIVSPTDDIISNLSNAIALIHEAIAPLWTGIYIVRDNELILYPFQGPVACTRIGYGKGVCGTSWAENRTIVVADVETFPGHIACSSASQSEIVVPLRDKSGKVVAVLDIDSKLKSTFDDTDQEGLEKISEILGELF